jgi:sterol 3beta-glucosyltransferase
MRRARRARAAQGLKLQEAGHRVRLATHGAYRSFVEDFGLEFYPLGGDPKLLSQYIVKHRAPPNPNPIT